MRRVGKWRVSIMVIDEELIDFLKNHGQQAIPIVCRVLAERAIAHDEAIAVLKWGTNHISPS